MNSTSKLALAAILALSVPAASSAQSLLDNLKNAASSAVNSAASKTGNSTVSTVANTLTKLLGTSTVSQSSLVGTWTYTEPCIVAESKNLLSNVALTAATTKAEKSLAAGLAKAGVTAGKLKLTFNQDKTVSITVGDKTVGGTYAVSGSDLTITLKTVKKSFKMNCKLSSGNLQLAMNATKLMPFINAVAAKAASASSSLAAVSTTLKNVDGLYTGLQFKK